MVRRWILMVGILSIMAAWAVGQPKVTFQGTLKGYFLTPNGDLSVYEIPFAFPDKPPNEKLPTQLFPLWARYYLKMRVEVSSAKISRLQLKVGERDKSVMIRTTERLRGSDTITVPELLNDWLSVHSESGLNLVLVLDLENGEKVTIHPQYAVQLGPVQRLKIDWLDLVRIARIKQFLQEKGDELLLGLRADNIPFLLEGEEGQWVLVGEGFSEWWRYRGKVPKGLTVYLPPFRFTVPPEIKERVLAGVVQTRHMGIVVILHYQPDWDMMEEMNNPQSERHAERTFALLHEIVHYWFGQKFGWTDKPKPSPCLDLDGYLAWMMEGNALSQALNATQPEQRKEAIKDFLMFRWFRRRLGCGNPKGEQQEEWDEGLASFLAEKALELGREQLGVPLVYVPSLFFLDLEPFESPASTLVLPFDSITKFRDFGYVQAKLLDKVKPGWHRTLGDQKRPLDELLAKAVNFSPPDVKALSEDKIRKEIRSRAQQAGWARSPSPNMKDSFEVVVLAPLSPLKNIPNAFDLDWLVFSSCDVTARGFKVKSEREVMIAQIQHQGGKVFAFRWMLPPSVVLRLKQEERKEKVVLEGQGIKAEVEGSGVWRTPQGIVVGSKDWAKAWAFAHEEKPEEVTPIKLSPAWTIVTLAAVAAFGTGAAQAQGVQVTGVVSGRFLNTWTNTVEYHTIEFVSDPESSEYSVLEPLDDEEYEVTIQVTDPQAQLLRLSLLLTDGQTVSVTSENPTNQLTLTYRGKWFKILRPIGELLEWIGKVSIQILKTIGAQELEKYLRKLLQGKKKGILAIHVRIADAEQGSITGFAQVILEIWRGNKRGIPPPEATWIVYPDGNGDLSLPLPKAPDYLVRAIKFISIPACPEAWAGPVKVDENQTTHAQLLFYYHKPVKGRVVEQTSSGQVPLSGATANLWKGDTKVSSDWESGSDGYFFIPPFPIDGILGQYGSGIYTVKVVPPSRSMMRPEPLEATKDVTLTKCERTNPGDPCPRSLTIDIGTFVFTYKPAYPGPGGQ